MLWFQVAADVVVVDVVVRRTEKKLYTHKRKLEPKSLFLHRFKKNRERGKVWREVWKFRIDIFFFWRKNKRRTRVKGSTKKSYRAPWISECVYKRSNGKWTAVSLLLRWRNWSFICVRWMAFRFWQQRTHLPISAAVCTHTHTHEGYIASEWSQSYKQKLPVLLLLRLKCIYTL